MKGEKVTISGADLIEGWKSETDDCWSASLATEPKKLLRDGRPGASSVMTRQPGYRIG